MLLKVVISIAIVLAKIITSELSGTQGNTNIAKTSKQLIEWYKDIITEFMEN